MFCGLDVKTFMTVAWCLGLDDIPGVTQLRGSALPHLGILLPDINAPTHWIITPPATI